MTAHLDLRPSLPGTYTVVVYGGVTTTPGQAQGWIDGGYKVAIRLWGDDPASDNLVLGSRSARLRAAYNGLRYFHTEQVSRSLLNEDDSVFDRSDEIYAGVRLLNPHGALVLARESNRKYGYY